MVNVPTPAIANSPPTPSSTQILEDQVIKEVFVARHGGKGIGVDAKLEGIHDEGKVGGIRGVAYRVCHLHPCLGIEKVSHTCLAPCHKFDES